MANSSHNPLELFGLRKPNNFSRVKTERFIKESKIWGKLNMGVKL